MKQQIAIFNLPQYYGIKIVVVKVLQQLYKQNRLLSVGLDFINIIVITSPRNAEFQKNNLKWKCCFFESIVIKWIYSLFKILYLKVIKLSDDTEF